jgi:hypothetical protein
MIKNDRQYRVTRMQIDQFEKSLKVPLGHEATPMIAKIQRDALRSQVSEMLEDVARYESAMSGKDPSKQGCTNAHVTDPSGRCIDCNQIVGLFDVMQAGQYLREGMSVRPTHWPSGHHVRYALGGLTPILFVEETARPHELRLDAASLLGLWEVYHE